MAIVSLHSDHEHMMGQVGAKGQLMWKWIGSYSMVPSEAEISVKDDCREVRLDPSALVEVPFELSSQLSVSIAYHLSPQQFASPKEHDIPTDLLRGRTIPLAKIVEGLQYIERLFEDRCGFAFHFDMIARETIELNSLLGDRLIEQSVSLNPYCRQTCILSHLRCRNPGGGALSLHNYAVTIGNLDREILGDITMFAGRRSESWQIDIDGIPHAFTAQNLRRVIEQALSAQHQPVLARIPTFLRETYPDCSSQPLVVIVTVPEVVPGTEYTITVDLRDPAGDLYYKTGVSELDQCIRSVHRELARLGMSVGPEVDGYQRVLCQLLLYRYRCASQQGYVDADVARKREIVGFHSHLQARLGHQLSIVPVDIIAEAELGNSRVDLLIEGIPVELKIEDRLTVTTEDIIAKHQRQAADYVARRGAPFGFLIVLDTVLERELPTSPVSQDVRVTKVQNVSGGETVVIGMVVRIPRQASSLGSTPLHHIPLDSTLTPNA